MKVPIERLLIGPDHVRRMDMIRLLSLVRGYLVDRRPVEVVPVLPGATPEEQLYQIRNGRHRFLHAVITGKTEVDCVIAEGPAL